MPKRVGSKKKLKYSKIFYEASHIDQEIIGYCHREHRCKKDKSGKFKLVNKRKDYIIKEKEEEWKNIKNNIKNINLNK